MAQYSHTEMAEMHFIYGEAKGNGRAAQRLYQQRYPNRRVPHHQTFGRLHERLCTTGSFDVRSHSGRDRTTCTPVTEEAILREVERDPRTSTRTIARQLGVSQSSVMRVLHDESLHPYHVQRVPALGEGDYPRRLAFARWFLQEAAAHAEFPAWVCFTDEATFARDGVVNTHNWHVWAHDNPRATRPHGVQQRFTINVWAGIVGDCLLGPYLLPTRIDGRTYRIFLEDVLPELLHDVPAGIRRNMWFQHDGAPAHFSRIVRHYLDRTYPARWIGRGGPVMWPPRSPDLTPVDFFLWGYLKNMVYETPVTTDEDLVARVVEAAARIRETPGIFERVRRSMRRRCEACIAVDGKTFEHLL